MQHYASAVLAVILCSSIRLSLCLSHTGIDEIRQDGASPPSRICRPRKFENFKNPKWKTKNCNISETSIPILMKFVLLMHIGLQVFMGQKHLNFKSARCQTTLILKYHIDQV